MTWLCQSRIVVVSSRRNTVIIALSRWLKLLPVPSVVGGPHDSSLCVELEYVLGVVDDFRKAEYPGTDAGCHHSIPDVWQEPHDEVILQACLIGGGWRAALYSQLAS